MVIIFSSDAIQDLINIANYTLDNWGLAQALKYNKKLENAYQKIRQNPTHTLTKARPDIRQNVRTLNVGKHVIIYHLKNAATVEIVRILHQSMDYKRHL